MQTIKLSRNSLDSMRRFSTPEQETISELMNELEIHASNEEIKKATDRINNLSDIFQDLENVPPERADTITSEVFSSRPYRPDFTNNDNNAWITRFDLSRPDKTGRLDGIKIGIKDNTCVAGVELTAGSHAFEGLVPKEHAKVVDRFLESGGRILGKTNMDELAFGPTSETSAFGETTNPLNSEHVAGGSSSGSAAAVANGDVDIALGTDTGGSVRIPASYCGVVGIKPTYGTVPTDGIIELSRSMDHPGILSRDVQSAAKGLAAIAGKSDQQNEIKSTDLDVDLTSLSIGVVDEFFAKHVDEAVEQRVSDVIEELSQIGANIVHLSVPELAYSRETWWGIAPTEFAAWYFSDSVGLWRTDSSVRTLATILSAIGHTRSRKLGQNIKEMLLLGWLLLRTHDGYHYTKAQENRAALRRALSQALSSVDVILSPGTPTTALELGGFERGVTPPVNWNTHPTNLTGHPSIVIPGYEVNGLPTGVQMIAPMYEDNHLLQVAHAVEENIIN